MVSVRSSFSGLLLLLFALLPIAVFATQSLQIDVTYKPEGKTQVTKKGDTISVHYTGTLVSNGNKFDSSLDRGSPLEFQLGIGRVIKGWDQGLIGMVEGEKRTLTIPFDMAYGANGFGSIIPPKADLKFTTELIKIVKSAPGSGDL